MSELKAGIIGLGSYGLSILKELDRNENFVVRAIADRVAVLYQGRLCEVGTVDDIYSPPFHPYTETLLGAILVPDPDHEPQLLASDTPELSPPATGCSFQRRCPYYLGDICTEKAPPWQTTDAAHGHRIRCHIPIEDLDRITRTKNFDHVNGNHALEIDPRIIINPNAEVDVTSPEAKDS